MLTQSAPGTPMGLVMRSFWMPALLASELPAPGCDPVRFKLLHEELVGWRNSDGDYGVMDAYCPHRGGPMYFGQCDGAGLRCPYHGTRFDVNGECIELPFVENGDKLKRGLKIRSYPVEVRAGMVWIYMGDPDRRPPLPGFGFIDLPAENVYVTKYLIDCNWVQSTESDLDPNHAFFLHAEKASSGKAENITGYSISSKPKMPIIDAVEDTPSGFRMVYRWDSQAVTPGMDKLTVSHFYLPSFGNQGIAPNGVYGGNLRVPLDDEHFWMFRLRWSKTPLTAEQRHADQNGGFTFAEHERGGWRPKANKTNGYLRDPLVAQNYNWTGISSFVVQDIMAQENQWGPIADRTKEHLFASDRMIVHFRRRMLALAKAAADGKLPDEPFNADDYGAHHVRIPFPADRKITNEDSNELIRLSFL